jgi:hypothetical protein
VPIVHQRLANEFLLSLSRRALRIIAPYLRGEEQRDAFTEFHAAFKEELLRYEYERLANELVLRLSRRALQIIAPCLCGDDLPEAFDAFYAAFKEEFHRYEKEQERTEARLKGARPAVHTTDGGEAGTDGRPSGKSKDR